LAFFVCVAGNSSEFSATA